MLAGGRLRGYPRRELCSLLLVFSVAFAARLAVWRLIPVDWNSDSYHHWQISYLSLKVGFPRWRMWDLNGCELYWGMVPHLVQAVLLFALSTASIVPYRVLNLLLGSVNPCIVYLIGRDNFNREVGAYAGLLFALYPVAAVFDVIAMQETLALSLALLSICLFATRPGWSGFLLALACQSRIEYWLASIVFVIGVTLAERFSTRIQSFLFSWIGVTWVFCTLFWVWTSNPFYPIYWSLYNVFGGWADNGPGLPFHRLMFDYIGEKFTAWSMKATGLALLGSFAASLGAFLHTIRRRGGRSHVYLFFFTVLAVFSPLFVTYYPRFPSSLLLMLRESIPIAALGSVLLCYIVFRAKDRLFRGSLLTLPLEAILIAVALLPYGYLIPAYQQFQVDSLEAFTVADRAFGYYNGGTIVCDHPTMNYRLCTKWRVRASDLLGNHYSPHYYGVTDPLEYANWFERNDVTIWIHEGKRADAVWEVASSEMPGLLVLREEVHDAKIYEVDRAILDGFIRAEG